MNDDFIPVIGVIGILIVVLGFIAIMRYITYKENLSLAEKGFTRPEPKNGKSLLPWGITITALGFGSEYNEEPFREHIVPALRHAVRLATIKQLEQTQPEEMKALAALIEGDHLGILSD